MEDEEMVARGGVAKCREEEMKQGRKSMVAVERKKRRKKKGNREKGREGEEGMEEKERGEERRWLGVEGGCMMVVGGT